MPNPDPRLSVLTFPQHWDGTNLTLRVLVLPKGDPRQPLVTGAPAFADAELALDAVVLSGLASLPAPGVESMRHRLTIASSPQRAALFAELASVFNIKPGPATAPRRPAATQIKKYLTPSYRSSFAFHRSRTPFVVTDDSYRCALTETSTADRPPRPPLTDEVTWGQVIAFAVKNPLLAERLGLLYANLTVPAVGLLDAGGFVYVTLATESDYSDVAAANDRVVGVYAARIPALTDARALFGAVLFAVVDTPLGSFDELFLEAESYDDGFAKIVHGAQPRTMGLADLDPDDPPPLKDVGIRIGWDDEQVAIWLNRQISPTTVEDTALGVGGYRLDAREAGTEQWHSMVRATGPVTVGEIPIGVFDGELAVQTAPVQLLGETVGDYWLPSFFTSWAGRSVVIRDRDAFEVSGQVVDPADRLFSPVNDDVVALRYGRDYEFRVRLKDLSDGGPLTTASHRNPAPAPVLRVPFRRLVPPKRVKVRAEPTRLFVQRPRLGYPDLVFTGFRDALAALRADTQSALAEEREPGVHNPDVTAIEIAVEVRAPLGDDRIVDSREPFVRLYTAVRQFDHDTPLPAELEIGLTFVDLHDVVALQAVDPRQPVIGEGPLTIPTMRDVRLLLRAMCGPDPELAYFGSREAQISHMAVGVDLRVPATAERELFVLQPSGEQVQAAFLQPVPAPTSQLSAQLAMEGRRNELPVDAAQRLGQQLDLDVVGATFAGRPGRRTVFGCSAALAHTLAPASSSITFSSPADLTRQWVIAIRLRLNRDWTWDGVVARGFEVLRDTGELVGTVELPRSVPAVMAADVDRTTTDLVFFDAIDGTPPSGAHPEELTIEYSVRALFHDRQPDADAPLSWSLRLPVTTAPRQTPKLVTAGLAFSPYEAAGDYSSTEVRTRMLWVEFDAPPADPHDMYFGRVLASAPDPMLLHPGETIDVPEEPPLPIDPEPMRVITPGRTADRAGLDAMQQLIPSTPEDPTEPVRHYLVPLPAGIEASSPLLFGFFSYEFRLGHDAERWSTAKARFGPPLRVHGVQHPPPSLQCAVARLPDGVLVSAPLATPVHNGRSLRPNWPRTPHLDDPLRAGHAARWRVAAQRGATPGECRARRRQHRSVLR